MDLEFIDSDSALVNVCERLSESRAICIDTEFHRETTYFPELALIQVSDGELTCCIDPLKISDYTPFLSLLRDTGMTKVLHASQQDLEIFNHLFDTLPTPVFDTQVAAGLLGYGDQIGYAALIKLLLNVDIDKSQSRTDWLKRPLSKDQMLYAANDVYYLAQAYPMMVQQLDKLGRTEWLKEDFASLEQADTYRVDRMAIWKKVKGHQKLNGVQLAILQYLAAWREERAESINRPRRRVLPDEALVDIARQRPDSGEKIQRMRSLSKTRLSSDEAAALLKCIGDAQALPKSEWPKHVRRHKLNLREEALVDAMTAILKLKADEHRITALNLASRKDLENMLQGETDIPLLQGWRYSHAGKALERFLQGQTQLEAHAGECRIRP